MAAGHSCLAAAAREFADAPKLRQDRLCRRDCIQTASDMPISSRKRKGLSALAIVVIVFVAAFLMLVFFRPGIRYRVAAPTPALDSAEFAHLLQSVTGAQLHQQNKIQVLANGENFYAAELAAIAAAQQTVDVEVYIFQRGEITKR